MGTSHNMGDMPWRKGEAVAEAEAEPAVATAAAAAAAAAAMALEGRLAYFIFGVVLRFEI